MENSMSSMSKAGVGRSQYERTTVGGGDDECRAEESTWTMYFEDFFRNDESGDHLNHINDQEDGCNNDHLANSLVISDAASFVAVKRAMSCNERFATKKKRSAEGAVLADDDLQDTASSPSNSPKVFSMINRMGNGSIRGKDAITKENFQEQRVGSSHGDHGINGADFDEDDGESRDLRKRGLCLVPLSMVANYLG